MTRHGHKKTLFCEGRVTHNVIRLTQKMFVWPLFVTWIILVIIVGAWFFFMMIGAIPMKNQDLENYLLNMSIQLLNVLFSYAAIANWPIRLRSFVRVMRCKGSVGLDHEGLVSSEIFDYIPWKHRVGIIICLNLNCICQFINQAFRIKYYSYELSNNGIAVLWVNLFFVLSFVFAVWAPLYQWRKEVRVRQEGRAPPGEEMDALQRLVGSEDYTAKELWLAAWTLVKELIKGGIRSSDSDNESYQSSDDEETPSESDKKEQEAATETGRTMPVDLDEELTRNEEAGFEVENALVPEPGLHHRRTLTPPLDEGDATTMEP